MQDIISKKARENRQKEIKEMIGDIAYWIENHIDIDTLNNEDTIKLLKLYSDVWLFFYNKYAKQM